MPPLPLVSVDRCSMPAYNMICGHTYWQASAYNSHHGECFSIRFFYNGVGTLVCL